MARNIRECEEKRSLTHPIIGRDQNSTQNIPLILPAPSKTLLIQYMLFVLLHLLMVVGSSEFLKGMGHAILLGVDWSTPLVVKEEFRKLRPIPIGNILPCLV
ncbi:hypothetical protein TNIN_84921 [Trichonephila inaurata madagascariensis]|uniref:Uncharacterized protein n=1 Tax=Trichonephila inaurata madagascariensis TaxID=2747483 RepID=A0A8X6MGQ0_9ARAC|nr:hypothetical protein TNIN_84921 [Trichonephila inaurata madagascariensis]